MRGANVLARIARLLRTLGKRTRSYSSGCSDFSGIPYRPTAATWKSSQDFETSTLQRNKVDLLSHTERKVPTISLARARARSLDSTQPELDLNLIRSILHLARVSFILFFFSSLSRWKKIFIRSARGIVFQHVPLRGSGSESTKLNNSFLRWAKRELHGRFLLKSNPTIRILMIGPTCHNYVVHCII